jgi:hypothetical protein
MACIIWRWRAVRIELDIIGKVQSMFMCFSNYAASVIFM